MNSVKRLTVLDSEMKRQKCITQNIILTVISCYLEK